MEASFLLSHDWQETGFVLQSDLMLFYCKKDMYDGVFNALKEELAKSGVESFPPDFRLIADWEYAEVKLFMVWIYL